MMSMREFLSAQRPQLGSVVRILRPLNFQDVSLPVGLQRRHLWGLVAISVGYLWLGWAIQHFATPALIGWMGWALSLGWGWRTIRHWHPWLPAMITALVLVGIVLPGWVLMLLAIPMVALFFSVWLMPEQTPRTALISSLFVYGLSALAACLGAMILGMVDGDRLDFLGLLLQMAFAFGLLSWGNRLRRRRMQPQPLWFQYGQYGIAAALGLGLGGLLDRIDWDSLFAITTHILQ